MPHPASPDHARAAPCSSPRAVPRTSLLRAIAELAGAVPACRLRRHLPPMPERDTKLFEVLIGQVAKDGGVDVALGKALRVLGHAELFEPIRDLLHLRPHADA